MTILRHLYQIFPYVFGLLGVWLYFNYIYLELLNFPLFQIKICVHEPPYVYGVGCPNGETVSFFGLKFLLSWLIHLLPHVFSFYLFLSIGNLALSKIFNHKEDR
jgi:hypothetical protein